jgi:hypothetical protein
MRAAGCAQRCEKPASCAAARSSVFALASPLNWRAIIRVWTALDLVLPAEAELALTADKTTTLDLP